MLETELINLAQKSTDLINKGNFSYYYHCGDYKFYNGYLAHWYKNKTNNHLTFVADNPINQIKQQLVDKEVDLDYNYNKDHLIKLKNKNQKLQLLLSGGVDSATILHEASVNNIQFDEVISVIYGNSVNSPENFEIKNNAIPFAKKYKNSYNKFSLLSITEEQLTEYYKNPYVLFTDVNFENIFPFFRQLWNQNTNLSDGIKVFGTDKPRLLFYKNSWYSIAMDMQLSSHNGNLSNKNAHMFWFDPENIKSLIKDSLNYRNYILKNNLLKNKKLQFFKINEYKAQIKELNAINRVPLINSKMYKKIDTQNIWNQKDCLSLFTAIKNNNLKLLTNYFNATNMLQLAFPEFLTSHKKTYFDASIVWAINIDTLQVYTQKELIPQGFEP